MYGSIKHIHLVGIGGIGMSGIGEVLLNRKYRVSGSDLADTEITRRLASLGATIYRGHRAENVRGADIVVTSTAISLDNPEVAAARHAGIPLVRRAEMLAELMRTRYGIAVAGAHGKTTTTSLVGAVLASGGLDPTVVVGGRIESYGVGARLGAGEFLVAEADESDASFLMLSPSIVVVTNIDQEHLDHYGSLEKIIEAFQEFVTKVPFYGVAVLCADDPLVSQLARSMHRRVVTYGTAPGADLELTEIETTGLETSFRISGAGRFTVNMPGHHNALNAAAAVAVGRELGITDDDIREALRSFEGVGRRFSVCETGRGITLVDDYGHHPTEIAAVLAAVRDVWPSRRCVCVFQPHRFSRTEQLWKAFGPAFTACDDLWLLPIYAAGEHAIEGVDSRLIFRAVREAGLRRVTVLDVEVDAVADRLVGELSPEDVVVTLGAGDVWRVHRALAERLGRTTGETA